jgi:hypothetical protein
MCVCVKTFPKGMNLTVLQKATKFSRQERESMKDQSKVKPYLTKA